VKAVGYPAETKGRTMFRLGMRLMRFLFDEAVKLKLIPNDALFIVKRYNSHICKAECYTLLAIRGGNSV